MKYIDIYNMVCSRRGNELGGSSRSTGRQLARGSAIVSNKALSLSLSLFLSLSLSRNFGGRELGGRVGGKANVLAWLAVTAKGFADAIVLGLSQHVELAFLVDGVGGHIVGVALTLGVFVVLELWGEQGNNGAAGILLPMLVLRFAKEEEQQVAAVEVGETKDAVA